MRIRQRFHISGCIAALLCIMFGQLLWLFDPIRVGDTLYWMDVLEYSFYFIVIVPLLWGLSAFRGIQSFWKIRELRHRLHYILLLIQAITLLCAAAAIVLICITPEQVVAIAVFIASIWLLIFIDMLLSEWMEKSFTLPWKGIRLFVSAMMLLALLLWPTSYMVTYPGLTLNMNQYAAVEGGKVKGKLTGVLVFERPAFPIDWLYARWLPQYEFTARKATDPPLGVQLQQVRIMQHNANQISSSVAFARAGIGEGYTMHGVIISGLAANSPAAKQLHLGDIVIGLNDHPVENVDDLLRLMGKVKPGDTIELNIRRNQEELVVTLQTVASTEHPEQAVIGVHITNHIVLDLPRTVDYRSYQLYKGGPSHGAMLALTLLDQLTPGGITFGNQVAGTGTLDLQGNVGRIGGIEQKALLVQRAGADVFFVPAGQAEEARQAAADLNIVPVNTLDDMLAWLQQHPK